MSLQPIRESRLSIQAAKVILVCGLVATLGFGRIAWAEDGDPLMRVVTVILAAATPCLAYLAARRARRAGDDSGSANV